VAVFTSYDTLSGLNSYTTSLDLSSVHRHRACGSVNERPDAVVTQLVTQRLSKGRVGLVGAVQTACLQVPRMLCWAITKR